jgi:uncharacterized protein YceK
MVVQQRRVTSCLVFFLLMGILLSGCASQYGQQITSIKYYPECYQPIQDLRSAEKQFATTVAGSVVAGALIGAIIGGVATGDVRGAAAGAVVGGAAGGLAGYALAKQRQIKDDNQRLASYLQDIDGDITGLDRVTAAAQVARKCYDTQFAQAIAAFKEGRMSRAELTERVTEINNGSTEASRILGTVIAGASDKEKQYQDALVSESQMAKRPVPEPVVTQAPPLPTAEPEAQAPARGKKDKGGKKAVKAAPEPKAEPVKTTQVAAKAPLVDTGDKLADISTHKARLADSKKSAEEEKEQMEKAQAERKKALEQLTG